MSIKREKDKSRRKMSLGTRNTLVGMSFILPNFIGFAVFVLIPVVFSFVLSFMEWDGFTEMKFAGLDNFFAIFGDRVFKASLTQTLQYSFFTVILSMAAALGLAILVNQKLKGTTFFRSAIFFPYVASVVAIGAVWKAMFMKDGGPVNVALEAVGFAEQYLPGWFSSTDWALTGVIIVSIWRNMGYFMIIYLAALQGIPSSVYEAAKIDGASPLQTFFKITVPLLKPTILLTTITSTNGTLQLFDESLNLTNGGPGKSTMTMSHYIYNTSFVQSPNFGYAAAMSIIILIMVAILAVIQMKVGDER